MTKSVFVVAEAHAEMVVAMVAEAEADVGENKDSGGALVETSASVVAVVTVHGDGKSG
jgi:hypothetical protein